MPIERSVRMKADRMVGRCARGDTAPRAFALLLGSLCATMVFLYVYWRYRDTDQVIPVRGPRPG